MIFTHLVFFKFLSGAGAAGEPPASVMVWRPIWVPWRRG